MFFLNPYDADLDISKKDDKRLFMEGCKGIPGFEFNGERDEIVKFQKLLKVDLDDCRLSETLEIATKWKAGVRNPETMPDIFKNNGIKRGMVKDHVDLIWATTDHDPANTPKFFKIIGGADIPSDLDEMEKIRNKRRLKHVMLGKKLWNSFTADYKIRLSTDAAKWTVQTNPDGVLLFDHIMRDVNPSTMVGLHNLKDELEAKTIKDFPCESVKEYNTWFSDKREEIRKCEGGVKYEEYMRNLFKGYLAGSNEDFISAIKDEKQKWLTGRLDDKYEWTDLRELATITYNNSVACGDWATDASAKNEDPAGKENADDNQKFLALLTSTIQDLKAKEPAKDGRRGATRQSGAEQSWKFVNKNGSKTCVRENRKGIERTWYWCTKDCHTAHMWCPRENCRSKAEHAKFVAEKENRGDASEKAAANKHNDDFRIALAAMVSAENFKVLEEQFLKKC